MDIYGVYIYTYRYIETYMYVSDENNYITIHCRIVSVCNIYLHTTASICICFLYTYHVLIYTHHDFSMHIRRSTACRTVALSSVGVVHLCPWLNVLNQIKCGFQKLESQIHFFLQSSAVQIARHIYFAWHFQAIT